MTTCTTLTMLLLGSSSTGNAQSSAINTDFEHLPAGALESSQTGGGTWSASTGHTLIIDAPPNEINLLARNLDPA